MILQTLLPLLLERLLSQPQRLAEMSGAAVDIVRREWTWDAVAGRILDAFPAPNLAARTIPVTSAYT